MSTYYNREGKEIPLHEWGVLFGDWDYKRLGNDTVNNKTVSTVWLGADHGYGGPPLIFETMVFSEDFGDFCERYATQEDALLGHEQIVYAFEHGIEFESLEELRTILDWRGDTFGVDYPDEPKPEPPEESNTIEI